MSDSYTKAAEAIRKMASDLRLARLKCIRLDTENKELIALLSQMPAIITDGNVDEKTKAISLIKFKLKNNRLD